MVDLQPAFCLLSVRLGFTYIYNAACNALLSIQNNRAMTGRIISLVYTSN